MFNLVACVLSSIIDTGRHGTSWEHPHYRQRSQHGHSHHHRTIARPTGMLARPRRISTSTCLSSLRNDDSSYLNSDLHILIHSLTRVNKQHRRSTQEEQTVLSKQRPKPNDNTGGDAYAEARAALALLSSEPPTYTRRN